MWKFRKDGAGDANGHHRGFDLHHRRAAQHAAALSKARDIDRRRDAKALTSPVIYEVTAGLQFSRSRTEAAAFRLLAAQFAVLPFDEPSAIRAADIRAELMRLGRVKGHIAVMIAGIAAEGGHIMVTRDRDFHQIAKAAGLSVESY